MSVLLLRLEGPMQSWGVQSRFTERQTESEPSKSGVIGLISSALGRSKEEQVGDLSEMKMTVRVDREGHITYDYHTTLGVLRASAKGAVTPSKLGTVVSRRFFVADACFLIGFEGNDKNLLEKIIKSLNNPKWPLFLGRKSFPASSPICLTKQLTSNPLIEIMRSYPWQGRDTDSHPKSLRLVYECGSNEGVPRLDVPISFQPRKFKSRNISTEFVPFKSLKQEA